MQNDLQESGCAGTASDVDTTQPAEQYQVCSGHEVQKAVELSLGVLSPPEAHVRDDEDEAEYSYCCE